MLETEPETAKLRWLPLMLFLIAAYAAGFIGSFATNEGLSFWYQTIQRPSWAPQAWMFAPMWTLLLALVGVAGYLAWSAEPSRARSVGLALYALQLVLVAIWPWLLFRQHALSTAAIVAGAMVTATIVTTIMFGIVRSRAAALLTPYAIWLAFLLALNIALLRLNA